MLPVAHNGCVFAQDRGMGGRPHPGDQIPSGRPQDGLGDHRQRYGISHLIHHSDRGCQYCSNEYVAELKKPSIAISMTQSGDPLENAIAERANGILKVEWLYKMKIATRNECMAILVRIIDFYNTQRPHMSIGMQTPEEVHLQSGEQRRCWKNSYAMG